MEYKFFKNELYQVFSSNTFLNNIPLETILAAIPDIEKLNLPKGTNILMRADLDMPIKEGKVVDFSRIEAIGPTVRYCYEKGWKSILFGHVGRDKENSAKPIYEAMKDYLKIPIIFIEDWLNEDDNSLNNSFVDKVSSSTPGSIFILQNTRKYKIEQALWKANDDNFLEISERMYKICLDIKTKLTSIEINEGLAASNIDFSSSAVPLLMSKTAIGFYISKELKDYIQQVRKCNFVVFSGLKIDKLDDLEGIVERGTLKLIISAGSLAMALLKARALLEGNNLSIGLAEIDSTKKTYISHSRIEQAKRIVQNCVKNKIELVLPVDFILDNHLTSKTIPNNSVQMDIGPETIKLFTKKVREYIEKSKSSSSRFVMFFNGVFGKFEDPQFAEGTKSFIPLLKELTEAGINTFVGGGEGRLALQKYGSLDDVTHAFTAGGTVLKSLTNKHIAFLKAMFLQNIFNKE